MAWICHECGELHEGEKGKCYKRAPQRLVKRQRERAEDTSWSVFRGMGTCQKCGKEVMGSAAHGSQATAEEWARLFKKPIATDLFFPDEHGCPAKAGALPPVPQRPTGRKLI